MIQILAPCGGLDSFRAAMSAGADAVYLGLKRFSARGNAVNFDFDELCEVVTQSRLYGTKVYLAFNTLVFDSEFIEVNDCIEEALSCGIDAVIVQDLAVTEIVKKHLTAFPSCALHASTQMSVTSVSGVKILAELGFSQVVLARELSHGEIQNVTAEAAKLGVKTEVFVHGAHCVSVSGQCYMSSLIGGNAARSGNRGMCAQPCRLDFRSDCENSCENYALSLKDLSLIKHIGKLKEAGVATLKIEGRMKRPEYVAAAVEACRKALSSEGYDVKLLTDTFSRGGFTYGYFSENYADMKGRRTKEDAANTAKALEQIRARFKQFQTPYKRYVVDFCVKVKTGLPVSCSASVGSVSATVYGEIPQVAVNRTLTADVVKSQMSKLGGTVFEAGSIECETDSDLAVSSAQLNQLRRDAIAELSREIIELNRNGNL